MMSEILCLTKEKTFIKVLRMKKNPTALKKYLVYR